jgi:hypothetical protein
LVARGIVGFKCSIAAGCMPIYTATAEPYNPATNAYCGAVNVDLVDDA